MQHIVNKGTVFIDMEAEHERLDDDWEIKQYTDPRFIDYLRQYVMRTRTSIMMQTKNMNYYIDFKVMDHARIYKSGQIRIMVLMDKTGVLYTTAYVPGVVAIFTQFGCLRMVFRQEACPGSDCLMPYYVNTPWNKVDLWYHFDLSNVICIADLGQGTPALREEWGNWSKPWYDALAEKPWPFTTTATAANILRNVAVSRDEFKKAYDQQTLSHWPYDQGKPQTANEVYF